MRTKQSLIRLLVAILPLSGSLAPFSAEAQGTDVQGADTKPEVQTAAKKKPRKKAKKAKKSVSAKRSLGDAGLGEALIFSEQTSFSDIVAKKAEIDRNPASIESMGRVISVRRELALNSVDSGRAPQDIILNAGTSGGIEQGMILAVVRKVPIIDPYRDNQQAELEVEYGKIKIIHAQKDVSVARLDSIDPIETGLSVGTRAVLVGDFVARSKR